MSRKKLTPGAVNEIFRLRSELDEWGEPRYSAASIAEILCVSESTIWRAIKQLAAYRKLNNQPSKAAMEDSIKRVLASVENAPQNASPEVQESVNKLQATLAKELEESTDPSKRVDRLLENVSEETRNKAKGFL